MRFPHIGRTARPEHPDRPARAPRPHRRQVELVDWSPLFEEDFRVVAVSPDYHADAPAAPEAEDGEPKTAPLARVALGGGFTPPRVTRSTPVLSGPYRGRVAVPPATGSSLAAPQGVPRAGWPSEMAVDAGSIGMLTFAAASLRGLDHAHASAPRQDAYGITRSDDGRHLVIAIADGVSNAKWSHIGADVAGRAILKWASTALATTSLDDLDWNAGAIAARRAVHAKGASALISAKNETSKPTDADVADFFGTTLACLVVGLEPGEGGMPFCYAVISGDGSAAQLDLREGWRILTRGKPASSGDLDIVSKAVIPLPVDAGAPVVVRGALGRGQAIAAMTDGIGDAFEDGDTPVGSYLFDAWRLPLDAPAFLQSATFVNDRSHDDRTAVVVWA